VFSALLTLAGFTVIPFIPPYLQSNLGWRDDQIPITYLCGGAATLLSARFFGRPADRAGKVRTFRIAAVLVIAPLIATTLTAGQPMWVVLAIATVFFTLMSARMIPGMAILTSAASPRLRGTVMTLNSAVQSASIGGAAFVGGNIISRDVQGLVQHYRMAAVLGACARLAAVWLVGRLDLHTSPSTVHPTSNASGTLSTRGR
jgi:predicted MFS family arabinose efflux permease